MKFAVDAQIAICSFAQSLIAGDLGPDDSQMSHRSPEAVEPPNTKCVAMLQDREAFIQTWAARFSARYLVSEQESFVTPHAISESS
jgi:hypothetical protein